LEKGRIGKGRRVHLPTMREDAGEEKL